VPPHANFHQGSGDIRQSSLEADRPDAHRGKAAFLEFLATAAGTWFIPTDSFERILKTLATDTISPCLPFPLFLIGAILLGEAVPSGQLFYGIAEYRAVAIIRKPWFAGNARSPV
jgi:hypothetical protein